jgi:hypothetical protein
MQPQNQGTLAGPFLIPEGAIIMSAKAKHVVQSSKAIAPVVVFGIDGHGKPKAARFGKDHAGLAIKAADQLQLRVLPGDHPRMAELFGRLPVGRVHASGRTFVPFVRRDVYDKLVAIAAPNGSDHRSPSTPDGGLGGAAGSKPPGSGPNLPKSWEDIGVGDLVVANGGVDEGWYEAIVVEVNGNMLTIRWSDYPRERVTAVNRNRLALLCPDPKPATENGKSGKPATAEKSGKPPAAAHPTSPQPLPTDWHAIDVGQLVLAKADGPWSSWWEAIPFEKVGDGFRLRWRDGVNKTPIARSRLDLALIRPDVA